MTGMLLTGSVFAGTAGRVNFIAGEVSVTSLDNSTHTLYKGDLINAGDKLETSKNGRLQIRFTDGSILSLKPNSIFSVEKYSFSRDTRLFKQEPIPCQNDSRLTRGKTTSQHGNRVDLVKKLTANDIS